MKRLALFALAIVAGACGNTPPPPARNPDPTPQPPGIASQLPEPVPAPQPVPPPPPPPDPSATFLAGCRAELAQATKGIEALPTATDKLAAFDTAMMHLANVGNRGGLWKEVHPDKGMRDAAEKCVEEASKVQSQLLLDRKVYDVLAAIDAKKLTDPEAARTLALYLRDYKLAGVALDDDKRKRIVEIDEATTKLGLEFGSNIAGDTRFVDVPQDRLAGIPDDYVKAHVKNGTAHITTDNPDFIPVMTYATDDALRKELLVKYMSRGDAHNDEVLGKVLTLRAEKAKLLGYKDWADYVSADKMLKGGKAEADFITRVMGLSQARSKKDYNELLAQLKKADPKATRVESWQKFNLEAQVKKAKYAVDPAEVRKYFVYDKVLAGLLDITSTLYDVQYKPVTGDPIAWHQDVQVFDVMRGADKLGRIYLDMHPRADKYKHFAQFGINDGVEGQQMPAGALVCNIVDPKTSSGPALMDHGDVVTMFHEFGHLMHYILGGHRKFERIAGTAVEQDFVEAPSQMFEEWAWRYETLSKFAKHAETGAVIPEELVGKMRKARAFGLGTYTVQQMLYAALSLELHRADPAKVNALAMVKDLQAKYTPFAYVEGTKFHDSFGHLMGYSSMYYTYMWSLVIAKDMLTPFDKAKSLLAPEVAKKYRDSVLAQGGLKDAADLVKDFLGRPYDFKAFEAYLSQ